MAVAELFRALGDPTRIEIVRRLSSENLHTISSVSSGLDITRQGARKHIQILVDAKLISLKPHGRDTSVTLNRKTLERGKTFIEKLERDWDERLQALKHFVEKSEVDTR